MGRLLLSSDEFDRSEGASTYTLSVSLIDELEVEESLSILGKVVS